jgi:hypothetical protein
MSRALWLSLAALAVVLLATAQELTLGATSDEQQMLSTSSALVDAQGLGISRGHLFTIDRAGGDAVSPYGLGYPLLATLPSAAAGAWEAALGAGASQTLFALLQIAVILVAAAGAGILSGSLGAPPAGVALSVLGAGLASPLWAYAGTAYSEPSQAAAIVWALAFACRSARAPHARRAWILAAVAGAVAGFAAICKSLNVIVGPVLLAPLLWDGGSGRSRRTRWVSAAAGAAGLALALAAWLAFEIARFGRPFSSYAGQGFTHPIWDGAWRLLIGPNKGLLWYFPLVPLSVMGAIRTGRSGEARGAFAALSAAPVLLLLFNAAWWVWDGTVGWGPRFLVPAVPLLASLAGLGMKRVRAAGVLAGALFALGVAVNALGVLQSEAAANAYVSTTPGVPYADLGVRKVPSYYLTEGAGGARTVPRVFASADDPQFSPIRLHAFLLKARMGSRTRDEVARRLARPPWSRSRPEAQPNAAARFAGANAAMAALLSPFTWPRIGTTLARPASERAAALTGAWDMAQLDQIMRALDTDRPGVALRLSKRLHEIAPSGLTAAFRAESLRRGGRREDVASFLGALPSALREWPHMRLVEALYWKDAGQEGPARSALAEAMRTIRTPALEKASREPLSAWPGRLGDFLKPPSGPGGR